MAAIIKERIAAAAGYMYTPRDRGDILLQVMMQQRWYRPSYINPVEGILGGCIPMYGARLSEGSNLCVERDRDREGRGG